MTEAIDHTRLHEFYIRDGERSISKATERLELYRFSCIVREIRCLAVRLGQESLDVVDAGAGWGQLSIRLAEDRHHVVALDFAKTRLDRFETRAQELGIKQVMASLEEMPLPDESADVVVCSEVLEHLPSPGMAIREFSRIMKPQGFLLITVPYAQVLQSVLCPHCGTPFDPRGHLHSFDMIGMANLLQSDNFAVCRKRIIANRFVVSLLGRGWIKAGVAQMLDRVHPRRRNSGWLLVVAHKASQTLSMCKPEDSDV